MLARIPIRLRLTLFFAVGTALVFGGLVAFVYDRTAEDILASIDSGLQSRAELIAKATADHRGDVVNDGANLIDSDEAFAQVLSANGSIVDSSPPIAGEPLLAAGQLNAMQSPTFATRSVKGIDFDVRLLVDPVVIGGARYYVVVGSKLADRQDALDNLLFELLWAGAIAVALMSFAGWVLAGVALRPVEEMRREAEAISVLEPERRLRAPPANDELGHLGRTLNDLLGRLSTALEGERRFVDQASHELFSPLSVLKAELDLSAKRPRRRGELVETLAIASRETDRLVRLSRDLLLLARMNEGHLPVTRHEVDLDKLVEEAKLAWAARAKGAGVTMSVEAPALSAWMDRDRVRQAIDNILDNAMRHTPPGGEIVLRAGLAGERVDIVVENPGRGFAQAFLEVAPEPFATAGLEDGIDGRAAGLGLAIVQAVAAAHGGELVIENRAEGGARVRFSMSHLDRGASRPQVSWTDPWRQSSSRN